MAHDVNLFAAPNNPAVILPGKRASCLMLLYVGFVLWLSSCLFILAEVRNKRQKTQFRFIYLFISNFLVVYFNFPTYFFLLSAIGLAEPMMG